MSDTNLNWSVGSPTTITKTSAVVTPDTMQKIALAVAPLTSANSLGIAVFAGMQRVGTVTEQVGSVAVSLGEVLRMPLRASRTDLAVRAAVRTHRPGRPCGSSHSPWY